MFKHICLCFETLFNICWLWLNSYCMCDCLCGVVAYVLHYPKQIWRPVWNSNWKHWMKKRGWLPPLTPPALSFNLVWTLLGSTFKKPRSAQIKNHGFILCQKAMSWDFLIVSSWLPNEDALYLSNQTARIKRISYADPISFAVFQSENFLETLGTGQVPGNYEDRHCLGISY